MNREQLATMPSALNIVFSQKRNHLCAQGIQFNIPTAGQYISMHGGTHATFIESASNLSKPWSVPPGVRWSLPLDTSLKIDKVSV